MCDNVERSLCVSSIHHSSILLSQLINHLTTDELRLGLPKKSLKPRTFILKPGQCLFLGGLGRLDYESVSCDEAVQRISSRQPFHVTIPQYYSL